MIRILLVDDQPRVRQGWRICLALESDLAVIGEAGDGRQAVALAASLRPDVIIMDVEMPEMDGISALEHLRATAPAPAVVMMSMHDDEVTRTRARLAGAAAFIGKQEPVEALLAAIRQAAAHD